MTDETMEALAVRCVAATPLKLYLAARLSRRHLARHTVDGRFCLANAIGTYDIMRGDFS